MAPNIDKEAEHLRNKAKKELLGVLEGVSGVIALSMADVQY
jgi:hypothetical protein